MKKLLAQYAAYNLWANQVLLETVSKLSEEQKNKLIESSFSSVTKTVLHLWDVESVWWQRIKLSELVQAPGDSFSGAFADAAKGLLQFSRQWNDWVQQQQEHMFEHEFIYQNTKKEQFKQPIHQVLLHLFNHQSYHRGQLVTMLRQLGVTVIPATDFVVWARRK